ncbi:hypothetical protein ACQP2F_02810 [Actinoplanes sp. CA-030573]|uniref:hypothetical protein n=1 Tax=Actinoplanes sp. CA-030573 TaxID=3239898 RepID=UPI003D9296A3
MKTSADEVAFGLAGGCVAVIAAAFVAAGTFAPGQRWARLLVMALVAGIAAARLADWRACAGVTLFAALVYVGFLADRDGDLLPHGHAWPYALLIVLAALLGRGQRRLRRAVSRHPVH